MTKDPAVLFYTSDFLAETILMSDEEVGQYIKLLCLQHQKGVLSEKDMKKICFSPSEDIMNKFVKDAEGNYYNEKWAEEINRRKNFCQSRRNNRTTKQIKSNHPVSGEVDMSNICSTHVEHMGTEAEAITGTKIETGGKGGTGEKPPANDFLPENVIALYHEHCPSFPHLARLTDARKTKIKIRLAEVGSMEKLGDTGCKPSLMLYGTFGNGKTTLARAIAKLITLLYASPYTDECKTVRMVSALKFITISKNEPEYFEQLKKAELLFIDDAGTEPSAIVKIWGNEVVPFTDMIYHRYERQLFTVITSNLTMTELSAKYGERIADRFEEMFDRIPFENNSYRKLPK